MDLEIEMENCSPDITNASKSNKQCNSGIVHTCDTEEDDVEDEDYVIVNKGGQQLLPASIMLLSKNLCAIDDEPWAVEEDDDYIKNNSDDPKILPLKKVGDKKNEKSNSATSEIFPNDKEKEEKCYLKNNDNEMYINSAFAKIFENIFDTDNAINTVQLKVEEKSDLSKQLIFNKNINNDQEFNETNKIIWNAFNIPGTSCSTSIPGTSSFTKLMHPSGSTYLSNTSCLTNLPVPPCSRSLLDTSWLNASLGPSYSLPSPSCSTDLQGSSCSTSLPGPSCSTDLPGLSCSTSLPGPSCSTDLPGPSCSTSLPGLSCSTDLPGLSCSTSLPGPSCSTDLPGPSCSTSLTGPSCSTDLPGPSCFTYLPGSYNSKRSSSKLDVILKNSNIKKGNDMESVINTSCDDFFRPMEIPITNNDTNQEYSKYPKLVSNDNLGSFECFQDDPDIVNPEIMYNIDLNEHYKYMDQLVQKITNATSKSTKQTVFNECLQLTPIPEIKHEPQVFTDNERSKFSNGIFEWEYKIDPDNWEKIMVKRAGIFAAHAGFDEANQEALYTLADVTTRYIKWIAVIMKKNFDIQYKSSCPEGIDPINNSLEEIGVKGGIRELIKHYDNDVFGRRIAVTEKCKELKKIIDQFVEGVKNQLHGKPVEENSTNEVIPEDSFIVQENKTEAECKSTMEIKSSTNFKNFSIN